MGMPGRRRALSGVGLGVLFALVFLTAPPGRGRDADPKTALPEGLKLPGRVESGAQVQLYARLVGFVRFVHADIGDRVRKGQVLAELAVPEVEAELKQKEALVAVAKADVQHTKQQVLGCMAARAQAKAEVRQAEVALEKARAQHEYAGAVYERLKKLHADKAVTQAILDEKAAQVGAARAAIALAEAKRQAATAAVDAGAAQRALVESDVKMAAARLEAAEAERQHQEALLGYARVSAPFDGVINRRTAEIGLLAGPPSAGGGPLFTLVRIDPIRIVLHVPEKYVGRLRVGSDAAIQVDALPGLEFKGKVARLAAVLDGRTHTLRAEIDLPNAKEKLLPGMHGTVTLDVGRKLHPPPKDSGDQPRRLLPALPRSTLPPVALPFDPTSTQPVDVLKLYSGELKQARLKGRLVRTKESAPPRKQGPAVQVLTLYASMPASAVEKQITNRIERWVSQAPGIHHIESHTIAGVSIVRVCFSADVHPATAFTLVSGLVNAALPTLPPGTLPPRVLPLSAPLDIRITGGQPKDQAGLARAIRVRVACIRGAADVGVVQGQDVPLLVAEVDRQKAAEVGLSTLDVMVQVAAALSNNIPILRTSWVDAVTGNAYFVAMRFPQGSGRQLQGALNVKATGTRQHSGIKLGQLVTLRDTTTAMEIDHADLKRVFDVQANVVGRKPRDVADDVEKALKDLPVPIGMRIEIRVREPAESTR